MDSWIGEDEVEYKWREDSKKLCERVYEIKLFVRCEIV